MFGSTDGPSLDVDKSLTGKLQVFRHQFGGKTTSYSTLFCIKFQCFDNIGQLTHYACAAQYQHYLDQSTPHLPARWAFTGFVVFLYFLRFVQYHIVLLTPAHTTLFTLLTCAFHSVFMHPTHIRTTDYNTPTTSTAQRTLLCTVLITYYYYYIVIRVIYAGGWYIISYALGIYLLNLLIGFLSPSIDPEVILMLEASTRTSFLFLFSSHFLSFSFLHFPPFLLFSVSFRRYQEKVKMKLLYLKLVMMNLNLLLESYQSSNFGMFSYLYQSFFVMDRGV